MLLFICLFLGFIHLPLYAAADGPSGVEFAASAALLSRCGFAAGCSSSCCSREAAGAAACGVSAVCCLRRAAAAQLHARGLEVCC